MNTTVEPTEAPTVETMLPLFYRKPTLLRSDAHAGFGLRRDATASFAAGATAIPIVASEFAAAGRQYPIVFTNDGSAMPVIVTGIEAGKSLFVEADGRWKQGFYVPAYIRRYPFIGITLSSEERLMLGFDEQSDSITAAAADVDALPLFDDEGNPTDVSQRAIDLCENYAVEHRQIKEFGAALLEHKLLVERNAQIRRDDDDIVAEISSFRVVDEAALRALPQEVVLEFHAKGWFHLIVLHLASQLSWQSVIAAASPQALS